MKALFAFNADVPWSRVVADQRRWLLPVGAILAINIVVLFAVVLPMRRSVETGTEQANASAQALNAAIADLKDAEATRDGQVDASKDLDRFYARGAAGELRRGAPLDPAEARANGAGA